MFEVRSSHLNGVMHTLEVEFAELLCCGLEREPHEYIEVEPHFFGANGIHRILFQNFMEEVINESSAFILICACNSK